MIGGRVRGGRGRGVAQPKSRWLGSLVVLALAAGAVSCGSDSETPVITVGAGDSYQSMVMAEIYAGALARTGAKTVVKDKLGLRADYLAALDAADATLVSDDTGDLLHSLDSASTAYKPDAVLKALYAAMPEGLTISDPADGTDLRSTVVTTAAAGLPANLKELAARCSELTVGINTAAGADPLRPPLNPRVDVADRLREVYGCRLDPTRIAEYRSDSDVQAAVESGVIQLGVLSMPAAFLKGGAGATIPLADPDYAFRSQQVIPVLRKGVLTEDQIKKLNYVAGELDTAALAELVRRARDDLSNPAALAREWLDAHAL
ncbi:transporter [Nocardia sp. 2]|uniref:Transporter n=1 Tax=Nocardia acididurans TaxID=2802282 RepID=A0ABS1M673_9NOCA|nr:glycine betaine ABC transporter substrate-binding protein [Nocardia acididurans]MBL1076147.1 transporter [Nocardia acididurans]